MNYAVRAFSIKFITTLACLMVIANAAFSQTTESKWKIEDGWKGLLPFKATRTDIEKLFGKGVRLNDSFFYQYRYETEHATVNIGYAETPCDEVSSGVNRYDVPEGTVIRYEVHLKGQIPVTDLTFNENRFERNVSESPVTEIGNQYRFERIKPEDKKEDLKFPFSYLQYKEELSVVPNEWNNGVGIKFWGILFRNVEHVRGIEYGPSYDDLEKHRCGKPELQ